MWGQTKTADPAADDTQGTRQGTVTEHQRGRKIIFTLEQSCWYSGLEEKHHSLFCSNHQACVLYLCVAIFLHPHFPVTKKLSLGSCCTNLCFFLPCFCHGSAQKWVLPLWPPRSFHAKRVLLSTCHYRKTSTEPLMKSSTAPCSHNTLTGFSESIAGVQWAASIPSVEIQLPLSWSYSSMGIELFPSTALSNVIYFLALCDQAKDGQ